MNTTAQRPTPETDDIFDAYARCACGTAYIRAKMQQIERERDEAQTQADNFAKQLEAVREAINEAWVEIQYAEARFAGWALRLAPNDPDTDSVLHKTGKALAKLQPFLKT